jgi:hypothetical protein
MKITFNKKEIEKIILDYVHREVIEVYYEFKNLEFQIYREEEFVTLTSVQNEEPSDET